jgi:hypothetical protein
VLYILTENCYSKAKRTTSTSWFKIKKPCILPILHSVHSVFRALCTLPALYSTHPVLCPLSIPPTLYSARLVFYPPCTLSTLYSTHPVLCLPYILPSLLICSHCTLIFPLTLKIESDYFPNRVNQFSMASLRVHLR